MTREEIKEGLRFTVDMFKFDPLTGEERTLNELDTTTVNACEEAIKVIDDFEALNAINLDLASENEDLIERIGKLVGYIDFLRNTAQGKKKSLKLLEKVVKGELEEIRAEGENFVKPRTGYLSIDDVMSVFDDFMCGDVDEEGTETFWEMLKDKVESEAESEVK